MGILGVMEEAAGQKFDGLRTSFDVLAKDRNLMAHGCWILIDGDRPWVVWHKFIEDDASVIGEFFERPRFEKFMKKAEHLLDMCKNYHNMLEEALGKKTSALTKLPSDK
jgi:hypothetical protein